MQMILMTYIGLHKNLMTGKVTGQELMLIGQVVEMLFGMIQIPLLKDTQMVFMQDELTVLMAHKQIGFLTKYLRYGM